MQNKNLREPLMQLLYQMEMTGDFSPEKTEQFCKDYLEQEKPSDYMAQMTGLLADHLSEVDMLISSHLAHWTMDRVDKVDLSILRLAVLEIKFCDKIPVGASINEAVELAKKFGTEDSYKFINGILGKIARAEDSASERK